MLDPAGWLPQAQTLALGQSRRFDHDCGGGRTLKADHKDDGWSAWCWRCNDKGWHPKPQPSLAERLARLKEKNDTDAEASSSITPPRDAVWTPADWPLYARVWLYKAGLSNDAIREAGLYYSPRLDRIVIPVVMGGRIVYWQARGFDRSRPKYLNPPVDKGRLTAAYGVRGPLVITEDVLSAIRVGEVCRGWSILGTALTDYQAAAIAANRGQAPVCVWLDPDRAGRTARAKVRRTLSLVGVEARIIRSDKDPKLYSKEEIRQFVYEE